MMPRISRKTAVAFALSPEVGLNGLRRSPGIYAPNLENVLRSATLSGARKEV